MAARNTREGDKVGGEVDEVQRVAPDPVQHREEALLATSNLLAAHSLLRGLERRRVAISGGILCDIGIGRLV